MSGSDITYSQVYESEQDFDNTLLTYESQLLRSRLKGPAVLEMGCGRGTTTHLLLEAFPTLHVVDASERCLALARRGAPATACFMCSYFEHFDPPTKYDSIVLAHVLEHLDNPIGVLTRATGWLKRGGSLHIVVPHANSLHRRIGVAMGFLPKVDALNERDLSLGHRRVYTCATLHDDLRAAGVEPVHEEPILLKILSNAQMEKLDPPLIKALFQLGHQFPDLCADLYVHARPSGAGFNVRGGTEAKRALPKTKAQEK
jgi:SAM-dependent methyltransferase